MRIPLHVNSNCPGHTTLFACFILAVSGCNPANGPGRATTPAAQPDGTGPAAGDREAFVEDLGRRTFDYFWETTDPVTCLAPDRWPSAPFSSIAAVGFAITAYGVGAERGYVERTEAAERTRNCLDYFWSLPQGPAATGTAGYKGFFYHFLDMENGLRHATTELSSVDTSLMFAGILFAQSYFDRDTPVETAIRERADQLYRRAEWPFFLRQRSGTQAANLEDSHGIAMGWKPASGYGSHDWVGYNEGMLVYVLALGSPTHPVGRDAWDEGWAAELADDWGEYYGYEHLAFEPLFGHQYSHVWIDFRGIQDAFMRDKGIDYFENSRRATLSQREYAIDNPDGWAGYGENIWGLTACDGPGHAQNVTIDGRARDFMGYAARGASPHRVRDDGTIAPTAAGGSVAFTPDESIAALMAMKKRHGEHLYTRYGFRDAFNETLTIEDFDSARGTVIPGHGWIAADHLGIDQGPILAMLENYRSELIWKTMRRNPYIREGLRRIGFTGGWLEEGAAGE